MIILKDVNGKELIYTSNSNVEEYLLNGAEIEKNYKGIEIVTSDLEKGTLLGVYEIYANGELIYTQNIYLENNVINYSHTILGISILVVLSALIIKLKKIKNKKGKKK